MRRIFIVLLLTTALNLRGAEKIKWVLETFDGGSGTMQNVSAPVRSGSSAVKLKKTNAVGWIRLRSAEPVAVKKNVKYTFGGWFHTETSDLATLLLFRVTRSVDEVPRYDTIDRSNGIFTQSVLVNSAPGAWTRRLVNFKSDKDEKVFLNIVMFGNPAQAVLDDITFAPAHFAPPRVPYEERFEYPFSEKEVFETLAKRQGIERMEMVDGKLMLNGKAVLPVFYKQENRRPEQNRYREFRAAGANFGIATIFLSHIHEQRGVLNPDGTIDFALVDEMLMRALRRDPEQNIIVEFLIIEPYHGWGDRYPGECWQDKRGRRAWTTWGNIQGYTADVKTLPPLKNPRAHYSYMPSYSSEVFQRDISSAIGRIVRHIAASPVNKAVAGYHLGGGHDHQFQYAKPDYSPAALAAWRNFCGKSDAAIGDLNRAGEKGSAFVNRIEEENVLKFREYQAWQLKDRFAGVIKRAAGKPVTVSTYLGAPENYMPHPELCRNVDIIVSITPYAFRKSGYPIGASLPEAGYKLHNKLFLSEFDLRCWNYFVDDEMRDHYISVSRTFDEWKKVHRKLAGAMLAGNGAWWYYTMFHYFDDPQIMADIKAVSALAAEVNGKSDNGFVPDLCVVRSRSNDHSASSEYSVSKDVKMYPLARSVFERSGVPYAVHYLEDILQNDALQNFKVYVFMHTTRLTGAEKAAITAKLKNRRRMLVWVYGSGLLGDDGMDISGMRKLTDMPLELTPGHVRRTPLLLGGHPLSAGVPPMAGLGELRMGIFAVSGTSPHMARGQEFSVKESDALTVLARYAENGKIAIAMRQLPQFTSVYSGAPWGLTPELVNRLAKSAGAYTLAPAGQSVLTNGKFISVHALKSDPDFTITLPPGAVKALDADSRKEYKISDGKIRLPLTVGETHWILIEY